MSKAKELDQFFTTEAMASECIEHFSKVSSDLGYSKVSFLEPSAGGGSFLDAAYSHNYKAIGADIEPQRDDIEYANFIEDDLADVFTDLPDKSELVVIGNPPFGKRSRLALEFINKSFNYADTVAFVLPIQFMKYLTMKNIDKEAKLVINEIIDPDSFTFEGKPYSVRCVFQVWTKRRVSGTGLTDYRIYSAPPTKHSDFEMFIYNCVPEALWMFDHDWNFAVHRQGWTDFVPLDNSETLVLDTRKQWMFFKSNDEQVLNNLKKIDFNKLGERNTSVRGFGKADVVEEYTRLYGSDLKMLEEKEQTLF